MKMTAQEKQPAKIARRQYFIKKDFQTRFIVRFILVLIIGGIISVGLTLMTTRGTLTTSYVDARLVIQDTPLAILPSVILTTLITIVVVGVIAAIVMLLVSHKIAGPMFRFEKDIERIAGGDLKSHIHLRKGDQFQEMVTTLNTMIDSLNSKVSEIRQAAAGQAENPDLAEACRAEFDKLNRKITSRFRL
jgi:methyl-accepting chemotaxis protein